MRARGWVRAYSDAPRRHDLLFFRSNLLRSNSPEKQKNENDQEDQPQSSGWSVAPVSTMRPSRQRAKEGQDQNHDQYSSKHVSAPGYGFTSAVDS
jgi:hypothetical protein